MIIIDTIQLAEDWATRLGNTKQEDTTATKADGTQLPAIIIVHGIHKLIIADMGQNIVCIFYRIDLPLQLKDNLAAMNESDRNKIYTILTREFLKGRSVFERQFEGNPPILKTIVLNQDIYISADEPSTLNRFRDAIQELVNEGINTQMILGAALDIHSSSIATSSTPHEAMYR